MWSSVMFVLHQGCLSFALMLAWLSMVRASCHVGYSQADCDNLNLPSVPLHLDSKIEALSLSNNLLRRLTNASFRQYTKLKYLYLDHNRITSIENDTFDPLQSLLVLDLSHTHLTSFTFHLPATLERLYLEGMSVMLQTSFDDHPFPDAESLNIVSLFNNELKLFPGYLQNLSSLQMINLTYNEISEFSVVSIAPFCQLTLIDLRKNGDLFTNPNTRCQCLDVNNWTTEHGIKVMTDFDPRGNMMACPASENNEQCNITPTSNVESARQACFVLLAQRQTMKARKKYLIYGSILAGLVLICVSLCIVCYRRRRRRRLIKMDIPGSGDTTLYYAPKWAREQQQQREEMEM